MFSIRKQNIPAYALRKLVLGTNALSAAHTLSEKPE
jgi:hypothetical protein